MKDTQTAQSNRIAITIIGQEGDPKPLELNIHEHIAQLLRAGLRELYGPQHPNPDDYDAVVGGKIVEPLTKTVEEAGIVAGTRVSILPKSVSRG
jgi:hypothetical protein